MMSQMKVFVLYIIRVNFGLQLPLTTMRLFEHWLLLKVKIVTDAVTRLGSHHMSVAVMQGQGGALMRLQQQQMRLFIRYQLQYS